MNARLPLLGALLVVLVGCGTVTPTVVAPVTPPTGVVTSAPVTGTRVGEAWDTTTLTPRTSPSVAPEDLDRTTTTSATTPPSPTFTVGKAHAVVTKVSDGDTIHAVVDGIDYPVRIIGADTPETVDPRKPVQCFGPQASDRTKGVLTGQVVVLTPDPTQGDKDRYGRLLRYVNLADDTDWSAELITEGLAREYTYDTPYQRKAAYVAAQDKARAAGVGAWAPVEGGGCGWK